jgi:hypothetical protein
MATCNRCSWFCCLLQQVLKPLAAAVAATASVCHCLQDTHALQDLCPTTPPKHHLAHMHTHRFHPPVHHIPAPPVVQPASQVPAAGAHTTFAMSASCKNVSIHILYLSCSMWYTTVSCNEKQELSAALMLWQDTTLTLLQIAAYMDSASHDVHMLSYVESTTADEYLQLKPVACPIVFCY